MTQTLLNYPSDTSRVGFQAAPAGQLNARSAAQAQLANCLPLAGGTMTGSLNGTDAFMQGFGFEVASQAASFDGSSYIALGNPSQLNFQGTMSISLWMNYSSTGTVQTLVFGDADAGDPMYNLTLNQSGGPGALEFEENTASGNYRVSTKRGDPARAEASRSMASRNALAPL